MHFLLLRTQKWVGDTKRVMSWEPKISIYYSNQEEMEAVATVVCLNLWWGHTQLFCWLDFFGLATRCCKLQAKLCQGLMLLLLLLLFNCVSSLLTNALLLVKTLIDLCRNLKLPVSNDEMIHVLLIHNFKTEFIFWECARLNTQFKLSHSLVSLLCPVL